MSEFKYIPGYEGIYKISESGCVVGVARKTKRVNRWGECVLSFPEKVMTPQVTNLGYQYVDLYKSGKRKRHLIHRLVLMTFIGDSDVHCNHKDGDKTNNHISNLEYCTVLENIRHCIDHLGKKRGERISSSKLTESDVVKIRKDKRILKEIAKDYGVSVPTIHAVISRKTWMHIS